jgi:hypothetical protein
MGRVCIQATCEYSTEPLSHLPVSLYGFAATAVGSQIVVVGGIAPTGPSNAIYHYDLGSNKWTPSSATLPEARIDLGAVNVNGQVYFIGGRIDEMTAATRTEVFVYDLASQRLSSGPNLPSGRAVLGGLAWTDQIFVFGWASGPPITSAVDRLTFGSNAWMSRAGMRNFRFGFGTALIGDTAYTVGGTPYIRPVAFVDAYDMLDNAWISRAALPEPLTYPATASSGGRIFAFGGLDQALNRVERAYVYDPLADRWAPALSMPTARERAVAVVAGDERIFVLGGYQRGGAVQTVEAYDPRAERWYR